MKTKIKIKDCQPAGIEYKFFYLENEEINNSDYENIQGLILDGYVEGRLMHEKGTGWWRLTK